MVADGCAVELGVDFERSHRDFCEVMTWFGHVSVLWSGVTKFPVDQTLNLSSLYDMFLKFKNTGREIPRPRLSRHNHQRKPYATPLGLLHYFKKECYFTWPSQRLTQAKRHAFCGEAPPPPAMPV